MPNIPDGAHRIELPGYEERVGKVRHTYDLRDGNMLMVASDRVSTFDSVHPTAIPDKGKILTEISKFWFERADAIGIRHHLISTDIGHIIDDYPDLKPYRAMLERRTMLVEKGDIVPIEAIVRGNITGSGWKNYLKDGTVCGIQLPEGLRQCERLEEPLFTPSTKADEGHDINISFREACDRVGTNVMLEMRDQSMRLFDDARAYAAEKGIIIADTKFEWTRDGKLADEVLTPDSSRFWPADEFEVGRDQNSFDKQIVRNHVESTGWDKLPPAPELPQEIVDRTRDRYIEVYERLTGKAFA